MIDEIWDRQYQAGREQFHAGIERAFAAIGREIGKGLKAANRFEWNAPWAARPAATSKDIG